MEKIESAAQTGIKSIDEYHQKFLDLIYQVKESTEKTPTAEPLANLLHKLSFYPENYFIEEELLFSKHEYPYFKKHKEEHALFIEQVNKFQLDFVDGKKNICFAVYDFLTNWYDTHIRDYDNDAVIFLLDRGV